MTIRAIRLNELGESIGYTTVLNAEALAEQDWPLDQYRIVRPDEEMILVEVDDPNPEPWWPAGVPKKKWKVIARPIVPAPSDPPPPRQEPDPEKLAQVKALLAAAGIVEPPPPGPPEPPPYIPPPDPIAFTPQIPSEN